VTPLVEFHVAETIGRAATPIAAFGDRVVAITLALTPAAGAPAPDRRLPVAP